MKSLFDPQYQIKDVDSKIIASLERLSQVFRVFLWEENKKHHLSPIQLQILIFLYFHPESTRTVSHLAQEFQITKATVSDAVRILKEKMFLKEKALREDKRIYILSLTHQGKNIATKTSCFANMMKDELKSIPSEEKNLLLKTFLILIGRLQKRGVVSIVRMCLNCQNFEEKDSGRYYCHLLKSTLKPADLRLDCPEHRLKKITPP